MEFELNKIRDQGRSNLLNTEFIERVKAKIAEKYPTKKPADLLKEREIVPIAINEVFNTHIKNREQDKLPVFMKRAATM